MTYTDRQFGEELLAQLEKGYDPLRIAKWAFTLYLERCSKVSKCVHEALIDVFTMEEGPEFHIPEDKLRAMAQRFMASDGR